jgi:hypothetical protein
LKQIAASPSPSPRRARDSGDFGLVLRADHFDETRLIAYARDELQKKGDDLIRDKRGRLTLWSSSAIPASSGSSSTTARSCSARAGGARAWPTSSTTQPGDSAATNLELVRLVERAAGTHAIWGAAIVPAETRKTLAAQPGLADAATINTLSAAIDFGKAPRRC